MVGMGVVVPCFPGAVLRVYCEPNSMLDCGQSCMGQSLRPLQCAWGVQTTLRTMKVLDSAWHSGPDDHCWYRGAVVRDRPRQAPSPASASSFRLASFPSTGSWTHRQRRSLLFLDMVAFGYDARDDDSHFWRQVGDKVM